MSIEEQIRSIAQEELSRQVHEVEENLKALFKRENKRLKVDLESLAGEIEALNAKFKEEVDSLTGSTRKDHIRMKENLEGLAGQIEGLGSSVEGLKGRIEKLEEELSNRWSLVVKLRKYTLDQLMSEYKRLTGSMRPEQEEQVENAQS
jgi:hypothetical protein